MFLILLVFIVSAFIEINVRYLLDNGIKFKILHCMWNEILLNVKLIIN